MSNNLIPTTDEVRAIEIMSKQAVESKYVEKLGGYAGVFSIAMYARELGIPVMTALFGGMANIMGKITIAPQLMNAMIRKAGHKLEIDSTDVRCIIKGSRKDTGEVCTVAFSVEDAKKAGIYKEGGGWAKYPSDMCFARALSRLARRLFPDVIGMAYVEGEIEDDEQKKEKPQKPIGAQKPQEIVQSDAEVVEPTEEELLTQCNDKFGKNEHPDFPVVEFVKFCANKQKIPLMKVAKDAIENEDRFKAAYKKWADIEEDKLIQSVKKSETMAVT